MIYSRLTPSPRYVDIVRLCKEQQDIENRFTGIGAYKHRAAIRALIRDTDSQTVLDYGCGQGVHLTTKDPEKLYAKLHVFADTWAEALGVDRVHGYDPASQKYATLPRGPFDGVYCVDVAEHIPQEDLPWILAEIGSLATKFVFLTIATVPAKKCFQNGENMHVTLQSHDWWNTQIERARQQNSPALRWVWQFEDGDAKE